METSKLTGAALDWAVAKCEGRDMYFDLDGEGPWFRDSDTHPDGVKTDYSGWELCGPIIEREKIHLNWHGGFWNADDHKHKTQFDTSPLVAAMRCYVASRLGDEVEVPEELK